MSANVTVRMAGDVAIVDMTGRFIITEGCNLLREAVKELVDSGQKKILLNLLGVTYIDSCGLGQLAGCYTTTSRMGGQMKVLCGQGKVNDMLQVTKLFTVFVVFSEEGEAVRSFAA
jgi:anti-sigma B factor antagonist